MKTAEEVINAILNGHHDRAKFTVKQYARQVAEQALLDASRKLSDRHKSLADFKISKEEILETELKLP